MISATSPISPAAAPPSPFRNRSGAQGSEIVPASVLLVSAKRGGILIGAFDETGLAGFVWSMPGVRDGVANALVAHAGRLGPSPAGTGWASS